jgi:hypothetical protein
MYRVSDALGKFAPAGVQIVARPEIADFVVLHVIDYDGVPEAIEHLKEFGQKYAIVQYCMRSTSKPNTADWADIWKNTPVWSYYDLYRLCKEDGVDPDAVLPQMFCAPLGCDAEVFSSRRLSQKYLVATSGYVAESECVDAVSAAVQRVDGKQFHLGPDLTLGSHVVSKLGISDTELARCYNSSQFVTGLRRCEGFELPMVEGLFCGCRPITFDQPHYALWFNEVAEFVPEGSSEDVSAAVEEIFKRGKREVTPSEMQMAKELFDWSQIIPEFWKFAL